MDLATAISIDLYCVYARGRSLVNTHAQSHVRTHTHRLAHIRQFAHRLTATTTSVHEDVCATKADAKRYTLSCAVLDEDTSRDTTG